MCSKPTRCSRISFSYMCMTMSSSSAWIAAMPPHAATIFKTSHWLPAGTMRPFWVGRLSVVNSLTLAWPSWIASGSAARWASGTLPLSHRWKP